jgi:peroxiredoxin
MPALSSTTLKLGDRAPNFTLPDLDGRPFELADVIEGGSALLSFAPGVWSQATRRQVDELEEAHTLLEEIGVIPLIVVTQRAQDARRSLQAHLAGPDRKLSEPALSYPILADQQRTVARDYGVYRAFSLDGVRITRPAIFLIQPTGEIAFVHVGRNDGDVPDTGNLIYLVKALSHPRLVAIAPELADGPREVAGWDPQALPRIEKTSAIPLLGPRPPDLELSPPSAAISLPAATADQEGDESHAPITETTRRTPTEGVATEDVAGEANGWDAETAVAAEDVEPAAAHRSSATMVESGG